MPLKRLGESLLVGTLSVACAAWVLRLWRVDLALPLRYAPVDDTKFYLMLVKGIIEHGWYLSNPSLGAPFGQHLNDYPQGADNLSLLIIRGLAMLFSNPALVVNLFFLLTFALAGASAHLVLRSQGLSGPVAAVMSVLFSLLAYHFFRGESHLLLSAYYAVPLAAYLFLSVLGDRPLFSRRAPTAGRGLPAWASRRTLKTIVVCVVIGSDNLYYAIFAIVLLVAAVLIALVRARGRPALSGAVAMAVVVVGLGANLAPSLAYRAAHGANPDLERSAVLDEASGEAFSLRLTNLILPAPGSSIPPLRRLAARYDHAIAPGYCEACYASLGTAGTVGFLWLGVCALATLAGAGEWYGGRRLFRHAAAGVAVALAVGAVGGLSSVIEFLLTPDIRGWNRISVLIAFLSLLAVGLLLDSLTAWLRPRRHGATVAALMLAAVLMLGVYDQTSGTLAPASATVTREYRSDDTFVAEIQARLPREAAVFQLPYVPFPEGYPNTAVGDQVATYATKYEPLRGYLHSSTLRWSYGAVKGRPADWAAALAGQPLRLVLVAAIAAGFEGLWVDPAGFEPRMGARVLAALRSLFGTAPLVSPDRDLWFFDLRPLRAVLFPAHSLALLARLRELTLFPLRSGCAAGGLTLFNPSPSARPARLTVYMPGGILRRRLALAPGSTLVRISGRVLDAALADDALAQFDPAGGGAGDSPVVGLTGPPCPR